MTQKQLRHNLYSNVTSFAAAWGPEQTRQALRDLIGNQAYWDRLKAAQDNIDLRNAIDQATHTPAKASATHA